MRRKAENTTKGRRDVIAEFTWESPLMYLTDRPGEFLTRVAQVVKDFGGIVGYGFRARAHPSSDPVLYSCEVTGQRYSESTPHRFDALFRRLNDAFIALDPGSDEERAQAWAILDRLGATDRPKKKGRRRG